MEYIPQEITVFINNKNIIANIFRIQAYDSIMCSYFCTGFVDFMFNGNSLTNKKSFKKKKRKDLILNYFLTNL